MPYGFGERTDGFKCGLVGGRDIRPSDAGIAKPCDYCGLRYEEERLVVDEYGLDACPTCLYDPQPKMPAYLSG